MLRGDAITRAGVIKTGLMVTPTAEVVAFHYAPVPPSGSKRLWMSETYVDADRYRQEGGELVWRRSFKRAHSIVILPVVWAPSASSIPAVVTSTPTYTGAVMINSASPRWCIRCASELVAHEPFQV